MMKVLEKVFFIAEFVFLILALIIDNNTLLMMCWLSCILYLAAMCIQLVDEKSEMSDALYNQTKQTIKMGYIIYEINEMLLEDESRKNIVEFINSKLDEIEREGEDYGAD